MTRVDELVEIHQASNGDAGDVLRLLYRNGISAEFESPPGTAPNQRNAIVLIKVPQDQALLAVQLIRSWENKQAAEVKEHTTVARPWLCLIAVGVLVFAIMVLLGANAEIPVFIWVGGIVALASAALIRVGWRRSHPPARGRCESCGYNLRGNRSGRCPECGMPVPRRHSRRIPPA